MCGRYTLIRPAQAVVETFGLFDAPTWEPRFNIAPTQAVFVVRLSDGQRRGALLRWGLVPPWAVTVGGPPLINAKAETVLARPTFRSAVRKRRCLVPADGFFEWKTEDGKKQPHYFTLSDGRLFAFAGLWERWEGEGRVVESVAVVTTEANELVRPVHDRMPVILPREAEGRWLEPGEVDEALLRAYPAEEMTVRRVSPVVGSVRNEGPQCVAPAGPMQGSLF
jgi:putative SOS response-associated peptidase YedK